MKTKFFSISIPIAIVVVAVFAYAIGLHAQQQQQQSRRKSDAPSPVLTTNWLGYLVVGESENLDSMPGLGPYPKALADLQIGIRSDGVLVCRKAARLP